MRSALSVYEGGKQPGSASSYIGYDGSPVSLKTAQYNASADLDKTVKEIKALKKQGINTVIPDYPQPHWFYEICDREGMYVVDQANIHTPREEGNLKVGGTLSNDPAWLPEYLERAQGAYYRTRNHPCVIGFSLGGPSGNGYNMQKTYLRIKDIEPARPVIYRWANGEWNSDAIAITPAGGH